MAELEEAFGLLQTEDPAFFPEWQRDLPELSEREQDRCEQIATSYNYLLRYPPLLENTVKMVVVSPLLEMAGLYLPPFRVQSEVSVEIEARDRDLTVTGMLDVLLLCEWAWLLAIESKQAAFSLEAGRAQLLSYMLASPQRAQRPLYGLLTNGSNSAFIKLAERDGVPYYALSDELVLRNRSPGQGLGRVLQILKVLAALWRQELAGN